MLKISSKTPISVFSDKDTVQHFENHLLKQCGYFTEEARRVVQEDAEMARVRWACITSKSQRKEAKQVEFTVYDDLVTVQHHYSHVKGQKAPSRENEPIQEFSKKSHSRLMKKFKMMKKGDLDLPYFVTLTYQKNMLDFPRAKANLNAFFQRFRRIDRTAYQKLNPEWTLENRKKKYHKRYKADNNFKYSWKMEPQKRGSIHFHLMLFLPEKAFPERWKKNKETRLHYSQLKIGSIWNEISGQSSDFEPQRTKNGRWFGNMSLLTGTNVRDVYSWKMATGYLSKYMQKEVEGAEWEGCNTGRFWSFSQNFDFEPFFRDTYDLKEIATVREKLLNICEAGYSEFLQYEAGKVARLKARKNIHPQEYKNRMNSIKREIFMQKCRHKVNMSKIELGYSIQVQISHTCTREILNS